MLHKHILHVKDTLIHIMHAWLLHVFTYVKVIFTVVHVYVLHL